jgi:hypothetical protein
VKAERFYPDIEALGVDVLMPVRVAIEQMCDDPLWLERPECPYGTDVSEALRALMTVVRKRFREAAGGAGGGGAGVSPRAPRTANGNKWEELQAEAAALYEELAVFKRDADAMGDGGMDVKEKLAYFRTATQLLDKLVALGERAANLRRVSDFQERVLRVFDVVLTPAQRTQAQGILAGEAGE